MYKCATEEREMSSERSNTINLNFVGSFTINYNRVTRPRAIKEAIREINAQRCEINYAKLKFKEKYNFCDVKARNVFVKSKVTTAMIKCAYGVNPYGVRMSMINNNECGHECPRYNEVET